MGRPTSNPPAPGAVGIEIPRYVDVQRRADAAHEPERGNPRRERHRHDDEPQAERSHAGARHVATGHRAGPGNGHRRRRVPASLDGGNEAGRHIVDMDWLHQIMAAARARVAPNKLEQALDVALLRPTTDHRQVRQMPCEDPRAARFLDSDTNRSPIRS
jgi:hypothetical protein